MRHVYYVVVHYLYSFLVDLVAMRIGVSERSQELELCTYWNISMHQHKYWTNLQVYRVTIE